MVLGRLFGNRSGLVMPTYALCMRYAVENAARFWWAQGLEGRRGTIC